MALAITRLHAAIVAAGIPIVGACGDKNMLRIDFGPGVTDQQRSQAQAIAQSFDWLDAPDPDPKGFVRAIAKSTSNTGLLLVAQRLSYIAEDAPQLLKDKYKEHAALPAAQKQALEAAAGQAGLQLV